MLKQYKKRKKKKFNFGFLIIIIAMALFGISIILIFQSFLENKKKLDDETLNLLGKTPEKITTSEDISALESGSSGEETVNMTIDMDKIFDTPFTKSLPVEKKYLDEVIFIGDKITAGLNIYKPGNAVIAAEQGLSTRNILSEPIKTLDNKNVLEYLDENYTKYIYIMFGMDELETLSEEEFNISYSVVIKTLKTRYPSSLIYVQTITPVNKSYDENASIINNEKIKLFNAEIAKIAKENSVLLLDIHSEFSDENGSLIQGASPVDGILFSEEYFEKWKEYILSHTVPEYLEGNFIVPYIVEETSSKAD